MYAVKRGITLEVIRYWFSEIDASADSRVRASGSRDLQSARMQALYRRFAHLLSLPITPIMVLNGLDCCSERKTAAPVVDGCWPWPMDEFFCLADAFGFPVHVVTSLNTLS